MDLFLVTSLRVEDLGAVRAGRGDVWMLLEELNAEVLVGDGDLRASMILTLRFRWGVEGSPADCRRPGENHGK